MATYLHRSNSHFEDRYHHDMVMATQGPQRAPHELRTSQLTNLSSSVTQTDRDSPNAEPEAYGIGDEREHALALPLASADVDE